MEFAGELFIPDAAGVQPTVQQKMYQQHINRYQFAAFFATGRRVLDLGCGVGYGSQQLETKRPETLVGLDMAEDATLDGQVAQPDTETTECKELRF